MKIIFIPKIFWVLLVVSFTIAYAVFQKSFYVKNLENNSHKDVVRFLPDFKVQNFPSEGFVSKENLFQDKSRLIILHFWGTWCAPCEEEFPSLLRFAKDLEDNQQIKFVLIAVQDSSKDVQKFIKKFPYLPSNVKIGIDNTADSMNQFGAVKVPETFMIFSDGKILDRLEGPQNWENNYFLERVQSHLKK